MKKYWIVMRNTWEEITTYRLNFVMWRVRTVLQLLTIYFLWQVLVPENTELFSYSHSTILTYILGVSLISSIVFSSRTFEIGDNINSGNLTTFLIRPINYFAYWFWRDLGDKAMNILFSIGELVLIFLLLSPPVFLQTNLQYLFLALIAILLANMLYFFLSSLIGLFGFWSTETWAPRFILMIVINFSAGGLFPLDILPKPLFALFQVLPFPYLLYFPVKIYLGQVSVGQIFFGFAVTIVWTVIFYWSVKFTWARGLRMYAAQGR